MPSKGSMTDPASCRAEGNACPTQPPITISFQQTLRKIVFAQAMDCKTEIKHEFIIYSVIVLL